MRVRFEKTAEFLAVCASGDTKEAAEMLREVRVKNGDDDVVNCANADGITALHQVRILPHFKGVLHSKMKILLLTRLLTFPNP